MSRVSFVFATGESWLDRLVTQITRSRWSHVAIRFETEKLLVEALVFQGLILAAGDKYDGWPVMQAISREVDPVCYQKMLGVSREWGRQQIPYGYLTCAAIGAKALMGPKAGKLVLDSVPNGMNRTLVCSEMVVNLWRLGFPNFLAGTDARLVNPDDLFQVLSAGER